MPWVSDSRYAGYLGPDASPAPLEDDPLADMMHDMVSGITNIPGNLIFPRWQPEPPIHPDYDTDWGAVGVLNATVDWQPAIIHRDSYPGHPDGMDIFQRHEVFEFLASFYGPNSGKHAGILRDGLFIDQNVAEFRKHTTAVVEVSQVTYPMELFRQRWLARADVHLTMRREVRRHYPVQNVLRSQGIIYANGPLGSTRVLETDWDSDKGANPGYSREGIDYAASSPYASGAKRRIP